MRQEIDLLARTHNENSGARVSIAVGINVATDVERSALGPQLLARVTCEMNEKNHENAER